jgi:hypothetical protein
LRIDSNPSKKIFFGNPTILIKDLAMADIVFIFSDMVKSIVRSYSGQAGIGDGRSV